MCLTPRFGGLGEEEAARGKEQIARAAHMRHQQQSWETQSAIEVTLMQTRGHLPYPFHLVIPIVPLIATISLRSQLISQEERYIC